MEPVSTALREVAGALDGRRGALSPLKREAIEEVAALARDFDGSPQKLAAIKQATTPRQRFLAVSCMSKGDPAHAAMQKMLRALIASDGGWITQHGVFTIADAVDAAAKIVRDDGAERIVFPARYPWAIKPAVDSGGRATTAGVAGEPIYQPAGAHVGMTRAELVHRAGPDAASAPRALEWWEESAEA